MRQLIIVFFFVDLIQVRESSDQLMRSESWKKSASFMVNYAQSFFKIKDEIE